MASIPPPLPSRAVPPPLPSRTGANPYATPSQFDPSREAISTRDVQRAGGKTYGVWVAVNSTNVNRMKYEPDRDQNGQKSSGTIWIEFLSGAMYAYPNRPASDWLDLFESSSKGRFTYYEVRGPGPSRQGMGIWPSIKIRDGWRTSAEIRAIAKKRQPMTAQQRKRTYTRHGQRGAFGKGGLRVR